ncbi:MAG: hypothetical protein ACI4S4_00650 [Candidatus Ornithospirochaeta sp.]
MKKKRFFESALALVLAVSMLVSCTPNMSGPSGLDVDKIARVSARAIDREYSMVRSILLESGEYSEEEIFSYGNVDGESVVRGALDGGNEDVLAFLCAAEEAKDTKEVLEAARPLLSEEDYRNLRNKVNEIEERAEAWGERAVRSLAPSQKEAFYKELRSMVVKTVVLLTAAIVYAFMPKTMFWGKVSAATAVSVAAGVVASAFITLMEWKDVDLKYVDKNVDGWLEDITAEPFTAWAIAQGVLNTQMAATKNPVTSALVLGVFALYNIGDDAKTLLKKYNFEV